MLRARARAELNTTPSPDTAKHHPVPPLSVGIAAGRFRKGATRAAAAERAEPEAAAELSAEEAQRIMVMTSLNAEVAQPRRNREAGGARPVTAPWVYLAHRGDKETRRFGPTPRIREPRRGWGANPAEGILNDRIRR